MHAEKGRRTDRIEAVAAVTPETNATWTYSFRTGDRARGEARPTDACADGTEAVHGT